MFVHHGKSRRFEHNLKIAMLLSFVAGFVNVVGFISIHKLTTHVTGHFAFLVDDVFNLNYYDATITFLYILTFFFGAFISNILVEGIRRGDGKKNYIIPVALEIIILFIISIAGHYFHLKCPNVIAFSFLFAMGLQNSLVTKISNAVVRTTHLTGLFTDLGIEASQLIFYKSKEKRQRLLSTINLRARIITFFFIGGVIAAFGYSKLKYISLLIPAGLLIAGLVYDSIKLKLSH